MRSRWSWAGILLILIAFNAFIAAREYRLASGRTIIVELVPVDPRSLMQGDYMELRYSLAEKVESPASKGTVYVGLDSRGVAQTVSSTPQPGLLPLVFRRQGSRVVFDAESYFYQEGQGDLYAQARYGELMVDESGLPMLVHLLDAKLAVLEP